MIWAPSRPHREAIHAGAVPRLGVNTLPGFQGVPSAGSTYRSTPYYPATFQARINRMAMVNSTGFVLAVPASIKLMFMNAPKKAAMPTKAPMISAMPMSNSP